MRKLLLLLPALALASCSGGHDLTSNEPFRVTCATQKGWSFTADVRPEMPQATVESNLGQIAFDLNVISPTMFRLDVVKGSYGYSIVIIRESGRVHFGGLNLSNGESLGPGKLKCTFKSL